MIRKDGKEGKGVIRMDRREKRMMENGREKVRNHEKK